MFLCADQEISQVLVSQRSSVKSICRQSDTLSEYAIIQFEVLPSAHFLALSLRHLPLSSPNRSRQPKLCPVKAGLSASSSVGTDSAKRRPASSKTGLCGAEDSVKFQVYSEALKLNSEGGIDIC